MLVCNDQVTLEVILKWNASIKRWFNMYNGIYANIGSIDDNLVLPVANFKEFMTKQIEITKQQATELSQVKDELSYLKEEFKKLQLSIQTLNQTNTTLISVLGHQTNSSNLEESTTVSAHSNNTRARQTVIREHMPAVRIPSGSHSKYI